MAAGKGPFFVPGWMIEQIQKSKWEPAFRPELRRNSTLQRFRDSGGGHVCNAVVWAVVWTRFSPEFRCGRQTTALC
jgi:hypothetical protein